ncbi:MAG TPA: cytochrome c oxidase subunit II [Acidimicrobiales bacterium]|nr:cytochrome c oxidase subunit II [Acidimicrobiales bacterium]
MRRPPRAWRLAVLAAAPVLLAGCELPGFGAPEPKAKQGESIFSLWQGFFLVAMAVGLLVWGLIIYVVVRYRRRDDTIPRQNPYNVPVEIFYTAAPVVVVAALFGFSVVAEDDATAVDPDPVARIDVVGFQWSWQFSYVDEDVTVTGEPGQPPEMVLPVGEPVELRLVSADVNHSFWVPDFLSKRDLIPGVDNEISLTPTETGEYVGRCAEFCGLDHWRMTYTVRVVEPDEYEDWLAAQPRGGDRVPVNEDEDVAGSGGEGGGEGPSGPTGEGP